MNYSSALNLNFFQKIATFFDIIPKVIYFLFAAITSGIDAMQCLVRKLAGLDTYYQGGDAVVGADPLTEFIYGILGIGDSAPVYKGLNTVFWSLAIFGLIVLVVSTIVAIIKSHYNEDTEGTSPWKYIYTAIKSVLTFAVMPVVVVLGMQLSSFVLRTLDNVTVGSINEGSIKGVYGAQATELFKGQNLAGQDTKSYMNYDIFGINFASNNTTFGGMLFEASMYSANRARTGDVSVSQFQDIKSGSNQIFGDSSNCPEFASLQTDSQKSEFIATQIDYAFSNSLKLNDSILKSDLVDNLGEDVKYWSGSDIFGIGHGGKISSFSKYDVSFVWFFYNLWKFNFLVGFAGGISIFGSMISIIVGLMIRLIKGAALFLVYPALLGIAPLDNFKAFKQWGADFMKNILMALGSIIGINLLLLIVPYLKTISFFGNDLVDLIVNVIILIAGIMMAKDFIGMVSTFVGGENALSVGDGAKGNIATGFKHGVSGLKVGAGVGKALSRPVFAAGKVVGGGIVTAGKMAHATSTKIKSSVKARAMNKEQKRITKAREKYDAKYKDAALKRNSAYKDRGIKLASADKALKEAAQKAFDKVKKRGGSDSEAEQARKAVKAKGLLKKAGDKEGLKEYKKYERAALRQANKIKNLNKIQAELDTEVGKSKNKVKRKDGKIVSDFNWRGSLKKAGSDYVKGKHLGLKGALGDVTSIGLDIADGIKKGLGKDLIPALGLDKLTKGMGDLFKDLRYTDFSTKFKWNGKEHELKAQGKIFGPGKPKDKTGDDLSKELADKQKTATDAQTAAITELTKAVKKSATASQETTEAVKDLGKAFTPTNQNNNGGNGGDGTNP